MPLIGSGWSKQTIYVGLLDAWQGHQQMTEPLPCGLTMTAQKACSISRRLLMKSASNPALQLLRIGRDP